MDWINLIGFISSLLGILAFFRVDAISLLPFLKNPIRIKKLLQKTKNHSFLKFVLKKLSFCVVAQQQLHLKKYSY